VQGRDEIVVEVPVDRLWPLIADSRQLLKWVPPVVAVEVVDEPEGVGSRRKVYARFGRRSGQFVERRIGHEERRLMAFQIDEETFGLFRFLAQVGSVMELEPLGPARTRVVWSFFHEPRGPLGRVMNRLVILRQQRHNRRRALASLKAYAETGRERPQP
jgi:uncharacterized membrane protein